MRYLLDTDVLSEIRKKNCHPNLIAWLSSVYFSECYISSITIGEIRNGIEKRRISDPRYAATLEEWLANLEDHYKDRILSFEKTSAEQWGKLALISRANSIDMQIAAIAIINHCTIATRNVKHFQNLPLHAINPFNEAR